MMHRTRRKYLPLALVVVGLAAAWPAPALADLPANDDFAAAQDLGTGATAKASGTTVWATAEAGEPDHDGILAKSSVWYRWTAPEKGVVRVVGCSSPTLAVYRGPAVDALGRVGSGSESFESGEEDCPLVSTARFFALAGTTYRIAVDGPIQAPFTLSLGYATRPANDDFAQALDLGDGWTASASGTNLDATSEPNEPAHVGQVPRETVWYRWTAPGNRNVQVDTCGSSFDTLLALYSGSALTALSEVASNDDGATCGLGSAVTFDARVGTSYSIAVSTLSAGSPIPRVDLHLQQTNEARISKLTRHRRRGTATLVVDVPNPGRLEVLRTRRVRSAAATMDAAGTVRLLVRPRGTARRRLARRGSAAVVVRLRFTPAGGQPYSTTRSVTLIRE